MLVRKPDPLSSTKFSGRRRRRSASLPSFIPHTYLSRERERTPATRRGWSGGSVRVREGPTEWVSEWARACESEEENEAQKRTARAPSPRSSALISNAQDEQQVRVSGSSALFSARVNPSPGAALQRSRVGSSFEFTGWCRCEVNGLHEDFNTQPERSVKTAGTAPDRERERESTLPRVPDFYTELC